jgi:hypothetical protein
VGAGPVSDVDFGHLDCALHVDGAPDTETLSDWVREALELQEGEMWLVGDGMALGVEDNDEAGEGDTSDPDDGFLFFDHIVEVYFAPSVAHERRVETVATLMTSLRAHDLRVVAAAAYEDELP